MGYVEKNMNHSIGWGHNHVEAGGVVAVKGK